VAFVNALLAHLNYYQISMMKIW